MGLGPHALALYVDLARDGLLRRHQSVMEIGSQDLVPNGFALDPLFTAFGSEPRMFDPQSSARELLEHLGFVYACIDMDGRHGAIRIDLNKAHVGYGGIKVDVVTNLGTTEHVFDQARCFKLIHDLVRPNGLMIHVLPTQGPRAFENPDRTLNVGYGDHGFFLYTPSFFRDLAEANRYETLRLRDETNEYGTSIVVAFRRSSEAPFKNPIQGIYH